MNPDEPRHPSPGGEYLLMLDYQSFAMGQSVANPRLTRVADGAVLLDLWGSAWDADPEWTGRGNLQLSLRQYPDGGPAIGVEINPTAPSFRFSAVPSQ